MVLVDGKRVMDSELDPAKHRFIGMFRWPMADVIKRLRAERDGGLGYLPTGPYYGVVEGNPVFDDVFNKRYQEGWWDEPQYVSIENKKIFAD